MESLFQDLRFGARRLLKSPVFSLIAILSLALGIGANAAIFSLVNMVLFKPLPVENPGRVVSVSAVGKNGAFAAHSYPNYVDLRDRNDVLTGLLAYRFAPMNLSRGGSNEKVWGFLVTGNYFDVLGVKPAKGRMFLPEEDKTRLSHPVAVLSYACWQNRFGGDPAVINSDILINGKKFKAIGVAPAGFNGTEVVYTAEVFIPFAMQKWVEPDSDYLDSRDTQNIFCVGRLKPGVGAKQAEAGLNIVAGQLSREHPNENEGMNIEVVPPGLIMPQIRNSMIGISFALMGLVGLVLLIACTNLANLLLARGTERTKEVAIRLAIGAGRGRIVRQLLTESVLLAAIGGFVGILLAGWIIDLIMALKPPIDIPVSLELSVDWRVLTFSMIISIITGIIFGIFPALQSTRPDLVSSLKEGASQSGRRRSLLRNGLVIAQISVSLILLVSAGLILRTLQQLRKMNPGFNPENALMMSFDLLLQGYAKEPGAQFRKQLLERVQTLPGVQSASITNYMPLSINYNGNSIFIEGRAEERGANAPTSMISDVGLKYFETMGTPLIAGRDFTEQDGEKSTRAVIVNETFAKQFFPGPNPIEAALGKRFRTSLDRPFWQIVGVAKDGKYWSIGEDPRSFAWFPIENNLSFNTMIVRTTVKPETMIGAVRNEIRKMDPSLPVSDVKTLREHMNLSLFPARAVATLLGAFGLLALTLAAIGIYGVMAYSVAQRTREVGIRMALGAKPRDVLTMILSQGMKLAGIGIVLGLIASLALTRLLSSLLYYVSATDVASFTAVSILLTLIVLLACFIPARRAAKVDPMLALRYE